MFILTSLYRKVQLISLNNYSNLLIAYCWKQISIVFSLFLCQSFIYKTSHIQYIQRICPQENFTLEETIHHNWATVNSPSGILYLINLRHLTTKARGGLIGGGEGGLNGAHFFILLFQLNRPRLTPSSPPPSPSPFNCASCSLMIFFSQIWTHHDTRSCVCVCGCVCACVCRCVGVSVRVNEWMCVDDYNHMYRSVNVCVCSSVIFVSVCVWIDIRDSLIINTNL